VDQLNWVDAGTVGAIILVLQVLKLIPPIKALSDWMSLAAVAIGIAVAMVNHGPSLQSALIGMGSGLAASLAYDKVIKPALPPQQPS
jgi:hypothetical protein